MRRLRAQATQRARHWLLAEPYTRVPFALDEPQAPAELLVEVVLSDAQRAANPELEVLSFNLDRAKTGALMYVTLNAPERQLFFSLETDGPTRVFVVSEYPSESLQGKQQQQQLPLLGGLGLGLGLGFGGGASASEAAAAALEDRLARLGRRIHSFRAEMAHHAQATERARLQLSLAKARGAGVGNVIEFGDGSNGQSQQRGGGGGFMRLSRLSSGAADRTSFAGVFSSKSAAARAHIAQIRNECGPRGTLRVSVAEARDLPSASEGSQVLHPFFRVLHLICILVFVYMQFYFARACRHFFASLTRIVFVCLLALLAHSVPRPASFSRPHSQIAPSPYCLLTLGGEKARTDHHADTAAPFFGESFTLPVDEDVSVLVANVHSHNMVRIQHIRPRVLSFSCAALCLFVGIAFLSLGRFL